MQIHELNDFTGTLGSGAYLAIDNGTDTGKISSEGLLAATEARIDNIIAGPAPSAEEIVDARLGADGVTYPTLGGAIRTQVTDLKSDLSGETTSRIHQDDLLSGSISALEARVANLGIHKVAQPLDEDNQPTDGTEGQSLRTKGDGTTEWADVGLPTDAQTAQAVSDWLDEHPEATTTVQDGAITRVKLAPQIGDSAYSDPINVLLLGVKNDGSVDCSTIINEATASHELYFPSGTYRVDSPLYLKNSIYGAGGSRRFATTGRNVNAGACLMSYIEQNSTNENPVGVINVVNDKIADILGISICCYSNEDGIYVNPDGGGRDFKIQNVTIQNVGNSIGMRLSPTYNNSRMAYIDNCSIFGRGAASTSTGILLGEKAYDSLITNCEIMGVQLGIHARTFLRISDTHIWTGLMNHNGHQTSDGWWENTTGIIVRDNMVSTNLYIDSAYKAVDIATYRAVSMYNTLIWNDTSMDDSSYYNQTALFGTNLFDSLLTVDGLIIFDAGRLGSLISDDLFRGGHTRISNVYIYSDKANEPSNSIMGVVGRLYYNDEFNYSVSNGKLLEIANIYGQYGGTAEIEVAIDNKKALVEYCYSDPNKFSITNINGNPQIYYKSYTDTNGHTCYKVYLYNDTGGTLAYVKRQCAGTAYMTSYYTSDFSHTSRIRPAVLDSTSGLTKITESKLSNLRVARDTTNGTSWSFTLPKFNAGFGHFLAYGGDGAGSGFFLGGFINTNNAVSIYRIYDPTSRTWSGTYSNGVLTISCGSTVYGGIHVIWNN